MASNDYLVVGGGMLGAAIGYGLARRGLDCAIVDAHDRDFRAARGNFGLVWVQGKGVDCPAYARWTRVSAALWPGLAAELEALTGIDVQYERRGGVYYCLGDEELLERQASLVRLAEQSGGEFSYRMLDHMALRELEPAVGPSVPGGSWSPHDGHVNPLLLLRALHAGFVNKGGRYLPDHRVRTLTACGEGYRVSTMRGELKARHLILAAGLDNARLAPMIGLKQPVYAQRGQVLVTERLPKLLHHPSNLLRQTFEGTVQIGDTKESVGFDDGQSVVAMAHLAGRACRIVPALGQRRLVRGWGALRILSSDGYPVYEQGGTAWAFSSHSGVTLAAAHVLRLAAMLGDKGLGAELQPFSANRFQG